jgi:hypothetical protein
MLPTKFRFIWQCSFRGEDLKKLANQKQELPVAAMFVNGSGRNEQSLYRTLNQTHFCASTKPGAEFPMLYAVVFFVLNCLMCEVVFPF